MSPTKSAAPETQGALEAARHICQEARVVLTSLRGGPPAVARGELAQDLMDLRAAVKEHLAGSDPVETLIPSLPPTEAATKVVSTTTEAVTPNEAAPPTADPPTLEEEDGAVLVNKSDAEIPPPPAPTTTQSSSSNKPKGSSPEHVGIYARPFLAVVMDPHAAGPHTLVALRALYRLLARHSLVRPNTTSASTPHNYHVALEPLMRGVLLCKFEQTDAGADEAVEMAIADLLALLVSLDQTAFEPSTLMDAFNTVFVTRNTFVHSPALCYHFEDVLHSMVHSIFSNLNHHEDVAARLTLEFLTNQLLHTPLTTGSDVAVLDEAAREAQVAHDATRVLCLRLTRACLRTGWGFHDNVTCEVPPPLVPPAPAKSSSQSSPEEPQEPDVTKYPRPTAGERTLLDIIRDDLCLSLLMTGQAIWANHDANSNISPWFISPEVLSEICATLSTLWNTVSLRQHLIDQFEQIFTGFYQRALVLLRKRANAEDPASFNANLVFDNEVELILESLADLLCLHEPGLTPSKSALETLFATYDCSLRHSDVAFKLMAELCRCCGGIIHDGEVVLGASADPTGSPKDGGARPDTLVSQSSRVSVESSRAESMPIENLRKVPAHLKELCAEALSGSLQCLFSDEKEAVNVSPKSPPPKEVKTPLKEDEAPVSSSSYRGLKSKKCLLRRAAKLFNEKSSKGLELLATSQVFPDPVTPGSIASFLRNGLAFGLDKKQVGEYLGSIGKAAKAGKSPPIWERDWFHKEVLNEYCALFHFEGQRLLDGLRMFLAAFRLPGEGQMIDRIIQSFADTCGRVCDESARLKLFSDDPKRASDPAFLLAYSIIMLNTDLHNDNIREDRKMSLDAFVRNNTDYGRDITEKGKELPRSFLQYIYESIRDEEIRTVGEGADGHMTVERWKDILRGSVGEPDPKDTVMATDDMNDGLKEFVTETMWLPVLSAIGALWGVVGADDVGLDAALESSHNMMLGAQGARLGMDMAIELLTGLRTIGRLDMFQQVFTCICLYTGLLGDYVSDAVDRTWSFVNSVEAQSAVIVAIQMARDAGDEIGVDGWKCIWGILFELRDLKLLGGGITSKIRSVLIETDSDLLSSQARREWNMRLVKGDKEGDYENSGKEATTASTSVFGYLFGSSDSGSSRPPASSTDAAEETRTDRSAKTPHGKEELVLWDDLAPSDDEDDEPKDQTETSAFEGSVPPQQRVISAGTAFESQLIHEDMLIDREADANIPVTGLERPEDTRRFQISPRARVRKRLRRACDFAGLVSDSRFMDLVGFENLITALVSIVDNQKNALESLLEPGDADEQLATVGLGESSGESLQAILAVEDFPLSPASEAFAEVLIAEITIRNRDRLATVWNTVLKEHYAKRLSDPLQIADQQLDSSLELAQHSTMNPGIEKCVTGLLRICACAVLRDNLANDIVSSLALIYPSETRREVYFADQLDRHLGEGQWRICRNVDGLRQLDLEGWKALLGLVEWCASVGDRAMPVVVDTKGKSAGLAEENPSIQAYRSLHLILHAPELCAVVPPTVLRGICALIATGERANFPKLSIAGLDLLNVFYSSRGSVRVEGEEREQKTSEDVFWAECWIPLMEGMADAAKHSQYSGVRQHAISMLTDSFLDKHGRFIPAIHFCQVMSRVCFPLAGIRIADMLRDDADMIENVDEIMIEFELCISLLFKPLLHHLKNILLVEADFASVWSSLLKVMEGLLGDTGQSSSDDSPDMDGAISPGKLRLTTKQLATEHLRNAVMVLIASGVIKGKPDSPQDISAVTWESIEKMTFCKAHVEEWRRASI